MTKPPFDSPISGPSWIAPKYRVFYYGHTHHEAAKEVGDVRVESFQTLAAKDAYAAANTDPLTKDERATVEDARANAITDGSRRLLTIIDRLTGRT